MDDASSVSGDEILNKPRLKKTFMSSRVSIPLVVLWPPETFAQLTFSVAMFFPFTNAYLVASCAYLPTFLYCRMSIYVITTNITERDHNRSFTDTITVVSLPCWMKILFTKTQLVLNFQRAKKTNKNNIFFWCVHGLTGLHCTINHFHAYYMIYVSLQN